MRKPLLPDLTRVLYRWYLSTEHIVLVKDLLLEVVPRSGLLTTFFDDLFWTLVSSQKCPTVAIPSHQVETIIYVCSILLVSWPLSRLGFRFGFGFCLLIWSPKRFSRGLFGSNTSGSRRYGASTSTKQSRRASRYTGWGAGASTGASTKQSRRASRYTGRDAGRGAGASTSRYTGRGTGRHAGRNAGNDSSWH
jgi:hypothetical protein